MARVGYRPEADVRPEIEKESIVSKYCSRIKDHELLSYSRAWHVDLPFHDEEQLVESRWLVDDLSAWHVSACVHRDNALVDKPLFARAKEVDKLLLKVIKDMIDKLCLQLRREDLVEWEFFDD